MRNANHELMDKCVDEAMGFLQTRADLAEFVRDFADNKHGFAWSSDPRMKEISLGIEKINPMVHTGASFAACLRLCQARLQAEINRSGPPT
jgi:hypothetical protein